MYLLDSKRPGGSVTVDDQGATVRRLDDPDLVYQHTGDRQVVSLACQTHDHVLATRRIKVLGNPGDGALGGVPQRVAEARCFYVHGEELVSWLQARPQAIAPSKVGQLAETVREAWDAQTTPA